VHPTTTSAPGKVVESVKTVHPTTTSAPGKLVESVKTTLPSTSAPGKLVESVKTTLPSTSAPDKVVESGKTTLQHQTSTSAPSKVVESVKTVHPTTTSAPGKLVESVKTTLPSTSAPSKVVKTDMTSPPPTTTATSTVFPEKIQSFNDIMGQWYLVATTYDIISNEDDWRSCRVATLFRHGLEYYLKISRNIGNQTFSVVDYNLDNINYISNSFVINKNKYNYGLLKSDYTKKDIRMLHIKNLGNSTENYLYTEKIEFAPNGDNIIDPLILKSDSDLKSITMTCYHD
jgi:chlorosome envelope protein H-like repeat protein